MKIVEINWTDAQWTSEQWTWEEASEFEPVECKSVGYLIADKKNHVVISQMVWDSDDRDTKRICAIPKGMIRKMRVLK